jgi:hypothetical protein
MTSENHCFPSSVLWLNRLALFIIFFWFGVLKKFSASYFTDKAKPFLLPVEEKDKADHIAKVRAAEEDIIAVNGIKMLGQGKKAIVEYTTQYKDLTPFAAMDKDKLIGGKENSRKAYFSRFDDGWRLEKKPGLAFMAE